MLNKKKEEGKAQPAHARLMEQGKKYNEKKAA